MSGTIGRPQRSDYGGYVNQLSLRVSWRVREEEQVISWQFLGSQQDVSTCRMKKRKQVDDTTAIA